MNIEMTALNTFWYIIKSTFWYIIKFNRFGRKWDLWQTCADRQKSQPNKNARGLEENKSIR